MKNSLHVLSEILTALIIACMVNWVFVRTHYYPQSLKIFFIIPMGSILIGMVSAAAVALTYTLIRDNPANHFLLHSCIAATLVIVCICFFEMRNVQGKSLLSSIIAIVSNQDMAVFSIYSEQHTDIHFNSIFNWINFIIEISGYYLGSVVVFAFLGSCPYCDLCRRFYKTKQLFLIEGDHFHDVVAVLKTTNLAQAYDVLGDKEKQCRVSGLIKTYTKVILHYCPGCFDSTLHVQDLIVNRTIDKTYSTVSVDLKLTRDDGRFLYTRSRKNFVDMKM